LTQVRLGELAGGLGISIPARCKDLAAIGGRMVVDAK
jgi:hypothetical protein